MEISVVIPTRDRQKDLARCLHALSQQTALPKEILVINNGRTLDPIFHQISDRVQVLESKGSLSYLFNLGWRKASAELVAYLNDDSEPAVDWIDGITDGFARFPNAAAVGGPTEDAQMRALERLYMRGSLPIRLAFSFYEKAFLQGNFLQVGRMGRWGAFSIGTWRPPKDFEQPFEVDHLTITNVAFRKSILKTLGGFDENFFYNHIDGDFFVRLKRSGQLQIFHPQVRVRHHVAPSGPTRDPYFLSRDSAYFLAKDFRPSTGGDIFGFTVQLLLINGFFLYNAISYGSLRQLRALFGFVRGLAEGFSG